MQPARFDTREETRLPGQFVREPPLKAQLEELLETVRKSEADWRLDDRIALALRLSGAAGHSSWSNVS